MSRARLLLSINHLSKSYRDRQTQGGRFAALDNISLNILRGECLALVGESGSGKTTLGQVILRLVSPDTGSIIYQDRDLLALSDREFRGLRPRFQMVFQNHSRVFDPRQTMGAALAEPLRVHGSFTKTEITDRVKELLSRVGLHAALLARLPHELSGGQRQRMAIARALVTSPEFLIADEPTSNLDAALKREIIELLRSLQRNFGLTLLLISHDLRLVSHIADRVSVIHEGRIVETARARDLIETPIHPYTKELINSARLSWRNDLQPGVPELATGPSSSGCHFVAQCSWASRVCHEKVPALAAHSTRHEVACHLADDIMQSLKPVPAVAV